MGKDGFLSFFVVLAEISSGVKEIFREARPLVYNFFERQNSSREFPDEMCGGGPRTSGRLGPGLTKSSAVGSYFQAGIPALSFSLSSRGVRVSFFRRRYRLVSGPANSVSGLTRGETFVRTKVRPGPPAHQHGQGARLPLIR